MASFATDGAAAKEATGGNLCGICAAEVVKAARLPYLGNNRQRTSDMTAVFDPSPDAYRAAMRGYLGHVSVITVGMGAQATGLVVTSAVSLSAEPPFLLVCINRASGSWPILAQTGVFGWSALGAAHQDVAQRFAGGAQGAARYDGADWSLIAGAQLLNGAPIAASCKVTNMIDHGTHAIVIGQLRALKTHDGAGVLSYVNGTYVAQPAG
jgi:flavin reductase (DIM6/NTAB) family NADH-FMN oxidoreductase RutF